MFRSRSPADFLAAKWIQSSVTNGSRVILLSNPAHWLPILSLRKTDQVKINNFKQSFIM